MTGLASVRVAEYWDLKVLRHLENPRWHLLPIQGGLVPTLELAFSTLPKSQWQTVLTQVIEDRSCEQRCHFCPKVSTGWSIIWPECEDTAAAMLNWSRVARMLSATPLHTHLATDPNHDPVQYRSVKLCSPLYRKAFLPLTNILDLLTVESHTVPLRISVRHFQGGWD